MTTPTPAPTPPVTPGNEPTPAAPPTPPVAPAPAPAAPGGFTPPSSQEELDRIITSRLAREREKFSDYEALKTKASELDTLREQQMSENERAIAEARREADAAARADEATKYAERDRSRGLALVDSFIAGATGPGGRLDAERVAPVLEAIDKSRYLNQDGGIDAEALAKLIDSLASTAPSPTQQPPQPAVPGFGVAAPMWPAMGQGRSETPPAPQVAPGMARLRRAFTPTQ